jgi:RES domain
MTKLPRPPGIEALRQVPRDAIVLPAGSLLWRLHFGEGEHAAPWNEFRFFGPSQAGRFDHHFLNAVGQAFTQSRGILYAAIYPTTCLAEVFQRTRIINRLRRLPMLVGFRTDADLLLLDLTHDYPTRAGASMSLSWGPRGAARAWSQRFYECHTDIHGLWYPSSMHRNSPAIALYERAEDTRALPQRPVFHRELADVLLLDRIKASARRIGYGLI